MGIRFFLQQCYRSFKGFKDGIVRVPLASVFLGFCHGMVLTTVRIHGTRICGTHCTLSGVLLPRSLIVWYS